MSRGQLYVIVRYNRDWRAKDEQGKPIVKHDTEWPCWWNDADGRWTDDIDQASRGTRSRWRSFLPTLEKWNPGDKIELEEAPAREEG